MTTFNPGDGNCVECGQGPIKMAIPVFRRPSREGGGSIDTELWCLAWFRGLMQDQESGR